MTASLVLGLVVAASPATREDELEGILSVLWENDWFLNQDSRYTNGLGVAWTTGRVRAAGLDWLPGVGGDADHVMQFSLGSEMYTAANIFVATCPWRARPQHRWTLRVGMVGPSTGAAELQKFIHELTGDPIPAGWDTQLADEPLLNVFYQHHRRVVDGAWYDASVNVGGGLGDYYVGANGGFELRGGLRMPDTFSTVQLTGADDALIGMRRPGRRWFLFACARGTLYGIARFLPTDGNTFQDNRSGERDDWAATLSFGLEFGDGNVHVALRLFFNRDRDFWSPNDDFGSPTLSYLF